jgi:hypothetical protein
MKITKIKEISYTIEGKLSRSAQPEFREQRWRIRRAHDFHQALTLTGKGRGWRY